MSQIYVKLTVIIKQEDDVWTAECSELGTATFGETFEEVRENIQEAVCLHLNTLEDASERERFFKKNNIKLFKHIPRQIDFNVKRQDYNTFIHPIFQPLNNPAYHTTYCQ